MKKIALNLTFLLVLIFNLSCAQNYEWKKIEDGLYFLKLPKSENKKQSKSDTLNIELYMFRSNEIDLNNPLNGKPTKYKTTSKKFESNFNIRNSINLNNGNEFLIKKYNEKEIPNYSLSLNKIKENEMNEIIDFLKKKYGIEMTEYITNKNDKNENVVIDLTIQPKNKIDIEELQNRFNNYIKNIRTLNPNKMVYVYKITR